jgi:excisionase family DNA binding protein
MTTVVTALLEAMSDEDIQALAERLEPILRRRLDAQPKRDVGGWVNTRGAAEHLACGTDRIHDLVARGVLKPRREGRRLLFRRSDLDACLEDR